ncbi:MAG: TonB-dependent receptor [Rhizobacter sp.]|nr:TonB-dependent receptor [Rhizobacter sp.]
MALASSADPLSRYAIHQPAQPLADSLRAVARLTGASLLFDPRAVEGLVSRAISGQFSAAEAVDRLLQGTGLELMVQPDGALVVRAPRSGGMAGDPGRAAAAADGAGAAPNHPDDRSGVVVAAGAAAVTTPQVAEKIEITGSRLRRIDGDTALPVNVYSAADVEKSGQPSLGRFLASLNEVSMGQGEGAFSSNTQGQGNVQLRGLPLGSTLVLVNGRRMQAVGSSAGNFFNLNLIPLAAVERVEVVPVGSSAVYGGDALAGVVNVILKRWIDGYSLDVRLGTGRGLGDGAVSLGTGGRSANGSWMLIGSASKATPLMMDERAFFRDADYRRYGGPDARARNCSPGTVTSASGANLPGLGSTFAGIPVSEAGVPLTIASFEASAGQANLCPNLSQNATTALVHGNETLAVHASGQYGWAGGAEAFGELSLVQERVRAEGLGLNLNNLLVPASNPNNPFGVDVRVTARLGAENGRDAYTRETNFTRALAGLRGPLGSWDYELSASVALDKGDRVLENNTVNAAARTAALATSDPAASLNPFATGSAASEAVLRSIWSDNLRETLGRKDLVGAFARGPLFTLPAGPVDAIVGIEAARDRYETVQGAAVYDTSRNTQAAYAEVRLPLLRGKAEGQRDWTMAALTLAGRGDRYSDFGSATTYQAGLELRPSQALLVRGSAATSFKPPTLLQSNVNETVFPIETARLFDPRRGNAPVTGGEWVRTVNPELQPETGKAYALGAVWEPAAGGTRLAATAWRVRIDDMIGILLPQVVVDNEALFPSFVVRGPSSDGGPGPITRVIWAESNFGYVQTGGFDLELTQSLMTSVGRWTLGASATRTTDYSVAISPDVAATGRVGQRFADYWAPDWKGRLSLGWARGAWSAGVASRYVSAYQDIGEPARTLGDSWVHDLSARVDLKRLGLDLGMAKSATLSLSIVNLADKAPQYVNDSPYYDITQADWRGRYASVRFTLDW